MEKSKIFEEKTIQNSSPLIKSEFISPTNFDPNPELVYITDYNGNLLHVNQNWIDKIGVKRENIDLFNIMDFYVRNSSTDLEFNIQKIRNGKTIKGIQIKAKNISGEIFDFEINSFPIVKGRRLLMVINIARDVTRRKEIEKSLIESEENYRLISENANDLIRVLNDKFEFEYINEKVHKKLLGYSKEDMLGILSLVFVHPQDRRAVIRATRNYLRGEGRSYEARYRFKNGPYIWFEVKAKVFHDKRGNMKVLSIARDINDRKLAELRLKESEEKYRLISETAYDLIGILNYKFKYDYINEEAFLQILGYTKDELIGKSALKFLHPDDIKASSKALFEGFKKGMYGAEIRFKHKNGNWIWIEAKGQTFTDINSNLKAIIISRDVTKRKLNEQKIMDSERKYRQLFNQMSYYKDLFAHDMSNILHVIKASTELLSLQLSEQKSKEIEELTSIIDKQIKKGTKLLSSTFTRDQLEDGEISIRTVKICDVLEDSVDYFKKINEERNVKIEIKCGILKKEEIFVKASYLLKDIFDNILNNAITYNNNHEVEIIIIISSEVINATNYLKIEFKDNGIGISDDKKELIFERGNKELKGSKGMGLGLSIVKKILSSYQGKIWVENRVKEDFSKGTNVVLLLREIK